jgi:hypothetical protein
MGKKASPANHGSASTGQPEFAEPIFTDDPKKFVVPHASDNAAYAIIDKLDKDHKLLPMPFPAVDGTKEPTLTLARVLGSAGASVEAAITAAGQIVFHAVGDTGSTRGPKTQDEVADKMVSDYDDQDARDTPQFFFHLGDVIYSFGEAQYYYDQFYDPYRNYPNPILALAGNHDGMVAPNTGARTLDAFLRNFCADQIGTLTPEAGGLKRTAQIQPGVYFTFEAPFLRIIALYSNTLEDPGVISSQGGTFSDIPDVQLDFLEAALSRVASDGFAGAVIIAHHHPSYTAGSKHGWSIDMTGEIDAICEKTGVWPHAVLSAHAHNYQRFTRHIDGRETPYIIAGNGGHGLGRLTKKANGPLRTPMTILDDGKQQVVLTSYDDQDYGYLRIIVDAKQLRIEYHPASDGDGAKTPDDSVTVDLAKRVLATYVPVTVPAGAQEPSTIDMRAEDAAGAGDVTGTKAQAPRRRSHPASHAKHKAHQ